LLADIQKRFAAKCGFQIVRADQQGSAANARAFRQSFDVPYPNIGDPDGKVLLQVPSVVRPRFIPSTAFLAPDHTVTWRASLPKDLHPGPARLMASTAPARIVVRP